MTAHIPGPALPPSPAAIDDLEADGNWLGLIDLLMEQNRDHADPAVERRLVTARHRAFALLQRGKPPAMGAPAGNPPDGPGGVPEIPVAALTAGVLASAIARYGCLLVRRVLGPDEAQHLRGEIDRAMNAPVDDPGSDSDRALVPFVPDAPYEIKFGERAWVRAGGGVWAADAPSALFVVCRAFVDSGITKAIEEYLGERPAMSVNKCTLRITRATPAFWHQDGSFLGDDIRSVNVWLALSTCGGGHVAPGLDIVPRRFDHVLATGPKGSIHEASVVPELLEQLVTDETARCPSFEAGDALLFDHLFLHRTDSRPDLPGERYAVEAWHFAPSAFPRGYIPIVV